MAGSIFEAKEADVDESDLFTAILLALVEVESLGVSNALLHLKDVVVIARDLGIRAEDGGFFNPCGVCP